MYINLKRWLGTQSAKDAYPSEVLECEWVFMPPIQETIPPGSFATCVPEKFDIVDFLAALYMHQTC